MGEGVHLRAFRGSGLEAILDRNGADFMRPTMFGVFSGQVPRLVSQKLVKDPHNRRITEAEPKELKKIHLQARVKWNASYVD